MALQVPGCSRPGGLKQAGGDVAGLGGGRCSAKVPGCSRPGVADVALQVPGCSRPGVADVALQDPGCSRPGVADAALGGLYWVRV